MDYNYGGGLRAGEQRKLRFGNNSQLVHSIISNSIQLSLASPKKPTGLKRKASKKKLASNYGTGASVEASNTVMTL